MTQIYTYRYLNFFFAKLHPRASLARLEKCILICEHQTLSYVRVAYGVCSMKF